MKIKKAFIRKKRKNESLFKYTFALLHLWLGLLSSIVIMTVCLTGSIYAFKNEIFNYINRDKIYVYENDTTKISLDNIQKKLLEQNLTLNSITVPEKNNNSLIISYTNNLTNYTETQYFHPKTLEIIGNSEDKLSHFFQLILDIHRNLLLNNIGKQIVGISTIILCFMLISGLILWFPKKLKQLKQNLSIKWKAKFYRINYDLHNTLGFYTFFVLLFIALTGLYITYPWMKNIFIVTLGGNSITLSNSCSTESNLEISNAFSSLLNEMVAKENEKKINTQIISLDKIINEVNELLPYPSTYTLTLPNEKEPRFNIRKVNNNNFLGAILYDEVSFDKNGKLKSLDKFEDKPTHKQFILISKPLHTGEILGLKSIILYFIVSLIGFSLPITGFIIWWKKVV